VTSYVLVHGGTTTGRYWDLVLPHLDGPAIAPDMPGRLGKPADLASLTVDEAAASMVADVEAAGFGEVVVVAHSSGGLEVPAMVAGLGRERVQGIVLNAAGVPPEGGNGFDTMQARHRELSLAALEGAAREGSGTSLRAPKPDPERLRTSSGEELSDEQHAFVADPVRSVEDSFHLYTTPVHWSLAAGIPVTYVVNLRDRAVPPDLQREMAARLPDPPTVVELDCGHLAAVTRPVELAAAICAAQRRS
jgi:pimeloyl-ACP methyl ester carboxylesterase